MPTTPMPPMPAAEAPRSYAWMIIVAAVVVIVAAAALYWWFMIMPSTVPQEQPEAQAAAATQISADADLVATEINALSTDGLDAELDQIDRELAQ